MNIVAVLGDKDLFDLTVVPPVGSTLEFYSPVLIKENELREKFHDEAVDHWKWLRGVKFRVIRVEFTATIHNHADFCRVVTELIDVSEKDTAAMLAAALRGK